MTEPYKKYKRKKKYLSHRIQGSLLGAMVVLEFILISLAIVYLYYAFNDILEQQVFSIHRKHQADTFGLLFVELLKTVLVLSLTNVIALLTAHVLWSKYVSFVVNAFRNELNLIGNYQLFKTHTNERKLHEVIDLLYRWEEVEIERCQKLHDLVTNLSKQIQEPITDTSKKNVLALNQAIRQLLPL